METLFLALLTYLLPAAIGFVLLALCIQVGVQAGMKRHHLWVEKRQREQNAQNLWQTQATESRPGGFPVGQPTASPAATVAAAPIQAVPAPASHPSASQHNVRPGSTANAIPSSQRQRPAPSRPA